MNNYIYVFIMAIVTYLIRMLPLTFFHKEIKSIWFRSFLYYVPYAVLASMTFPAIFFSAGDLIPSIVGSVVAILLAYNEKSLITVACFACFSVYLAQFIW